jgi:hypothetical protein
MCSGHGRGFQALRALVLAVVVDECELRDSLAFEIRNVVRQLGELGLFQFAARPQNRHGSITRAFGT